MKGFEYKNNTPEIPKQTPPPEQTNDINKISSESGPTLELELKNNEIEIQFIEDTIKNNQKVQNKEEIEKALKLAIGLPRSRPDLVASLYILEGNDEKALDLILGYTDRKLNYVMKNTLILLLKNKSKEEKEKLMERIKNDNPAFNDYIENRHSIVE